MSNEISKPIHRASFAKDKLRGGHSICVEGPQCNRFAGRTVPVSMLDGSQKPIRLLEVRHTCEYGGKLLAFYTFERDKDHLDNEIPF